MLDVTWYARVVTEGVRSVLGNESQDSSDDGDQGRLPINDLFCVCVLRQSPPPPFVTVLSVRGDSAMVQCLRARFANAGGLHFESPASMLVVLLFERTERDRLRCRCR